MVVNALQLWNAPSVIYLHRGSEIDDNAVQLKNANELTTVHCGNDMDANAVQLSNALPPIYEHCGRLTVANEVQEQNASSPIFEHKGNDIDVNAPCLYKQNSWILLITPLMSEIIVILRQESSVTRFFKDLEVNIELLQL